MLRWLSNLEVYVFNFWALPEFGLCFSQLAVVSDSDPGHKYNYLILHCHLYRPFLSATNFKVITSAPPITLVERRSEPSRSASRRFPSRLDPEVIYFKKHSVCSHFYFRCFYSKSVNLHLKCYCKFA